MGVRRQIYLEESDERLLEEESRVAGLSVSELIRRAIHRCYGAGRRLTWDEVFSHSVRAGSAKGETSWVYDRLYDGEAVDEMAERGRGGR